MVHMPYILFLLIDFKYWFLHLYSGFQCGFPLVRIFAQNLCTEIHECSYSAGMCSFQFSVLLSYLRAALYASGDCSLNYGNLVNIKLVRANFFKCLSSMCSLYSLVFLDARVNTYLPVDLLNLKILSTIKAILLGGVIQKQDEVGTQVVKCPRLST